MTEDCYLYQAMRQYGHVPLVPFHEKDGSIVGVCWVCKNSFKTLTDCRKQPCTGATPHA